MTETTLVPVEHLSDEQRLERLAALASCDGSPRRAMKRLKADGIEVTEKQLVAIRDRHSGMYMALAAELKDAQEEAVAQQFREILVAGTRLSSAYIEKLAEEVEGGGMPRDLERTLQALAKITQVSADKLLAFTGRPVNGAQVDPLESARELVRLGVLQPVARPVIDSTAEEDTDGRTYG